MMATETPQAPPIDWATIINRALATATVAGVVTGGIYLLTQLLAESARRVSPCGVAMDVEPSEQEQVDPELADAARLLGISADADADTIRAALRARFRDVKRHPDQGGDADEAKRIIGAKNLMIERLRS